MIVTPRPFAFGWPQALFFYNIEQRSKKERASKMIVTLRPFAHGWPGASFFTTENEGRKRESFENDLISSYGPTAIPIMNHRRQNWSQKPFFELGCKSYVCDTSLTVVPVGLGWALRRSCVSGVGGALTHQSLYRQTPDPPP